MYLNDRIIGLFTVLGGIGVILGTLDFAAIPGQQFGSAFFPRIIGGALILSGIALVATASRGPMVRIGEMLRGRAGLQVLAVLAAVGLWVLVSPWLGFVVSTALLIAGLSMLAGGRPLVAIAIGIVMSLVLFAVFGMLLRVPLPYAFIEALLT